MKKLSNLFWRLSLIVLFIVGAAFVSESASQAQTFREAFNKHNAVMLLIDPKTGAIVDANPAAGLFYGYSVADLRAMSIQQINQLTAEQVAEERKLAATEGRNFFIFRHKLATGEIRTVEVHSVPLNVDGRTLLYSIIRDVSKERRLEETLWHYQTQLEQMVDMQTAEIRRNSQFTILVLSIGAGGLAVLVVVLMLSLRRHKRDQEKLEENRTHYRRMVNGLKEHFLYSHDPTGTFTYVSPSITPILGYTREEFLTRFDTYLTDAPINAAVPERTQASLHGIQQPAYNLEIYHKDGTARMLEVLERPVFDNQGNVIAVEGIAQDITARLALEQDTKVALETARHASKAKSEFLANMSHELRTPLNSIIGFSEMMKYEVRGPFPESYREYTDLIINSGRLLLETVNSILDLAKIEAGKFDLHVEHTHMAEIVAETVSLLNIQAARKGIEITNNTHDMHHMNVDPVRIKQVFLNVISNAIKFTEQGSVTVVNHCDENGHNISVTDTGIGMNAEQIEIALKPFRQVHGSSLARRYQGTGLGLSLSRQIMELHGGELLIDSTPGQGTTVTLHFPVETDLEISPTED